MKRFRKIISIAVALVMLLTLCLSAPLTASAATVKVTVNNSGSVYSVDATVGAELTAPERVNGMAFLGWYSDPECTEEYGVVQANETRKAYAKYPSTFIGFEGKSDYVKGTDFRPASDGSGVVTDPTNDNNKVFKLYAKNLWANVIMPQYDDADSGKYMLESNHSYTFTFKFMIPGGSSVDSLVIRMNQGDLPEGGNGRTPFGQKSYSQAALTPLTWYTYSVTYSVGDASLKTSPQLVANWNGGTNATTDYIYFDDVMITDNDSGIEIEVDNTFTSFEGCTVNYDGGFASSTSASVSTEKAHGGSSSLKIAPSGANTYRSYAYNGKGSVLKLDSYTRYTVSYWYMATALAGDYTNIYSTLNGNGNVWDKNVQLNKTGIHSSALNEWHKVEYTVITGDCSSQAYLTFGLQTAAAGTVVYIDDVTVTSVEYIGMHDYYCDFSADFSHYGDPSSSATWPYYSSKVNFNTDDGVLYFPTTHGTAPSISSGNWIQHFAPYDGSGYYQFETNSSYRVVVRYKQTLATDSNTGYFSVGVKKTNTGSQVVKALAINNLVGDTEWKEYTFDFVTDSLSDGKYLTLTFGSKDGSLAEFEVDWIKVTKGPFINNNGEISKNSTAVGYEIATPSYDADKYDFIGWYSNPECTTPFGKVRENEVRTAYARYNKTVITFSEAEFIQKVTYRDDGEDYGGYQSGIVLDPNDATNKVFKLHSPSIWANFAVPVYDAKGVPSYDLIAGVKYTVSVDFKIPSTVNASTITIRTIVGDMAEGGVGRTPYDGTRVNYTVSELEVGKWYTYTTTFTATSDVNTKPYLFLSYILDDGAAASSSQVGASSYLYFDNVSVYNSAQFEKLTISNNGVEKEIDMVVGTELPSLNSNLDEQVFLGWYSDPECTVPFGAVQANETRTAYAKFDTVKITFGNADKQLNAGDIFTVPCYEGVENAYNLTAGKTYAMRFVYKSVKDSVAGKFAVLGNELKFSAYDAENANVWTPAAITFTATEATALQLAVISDGSAGVLVDDILIYEIDYTPETSVTAGNSTISATKPTAQNNMQTGKVSVSLADGEQLKVGGLTVTYDLYATAFSDFVTSKVMLSNGSYDLDRDNEPGNGNEFVYFVPANAKNIKISAEFVSADDTNIGIIAGSVREKSDKYSSGLRFRGRVYKDDSIKNVGFLLAPEKLVTDAGYDTLTVDNAVACSAINALATGVVYDGTDLYTDYQVLLTGDKMENLLDTSIMCVMYIEHNDGTVEYADAKTQSYNGIKKAMNPVYRGITSYHSEEYEDTRNKLLKTQNDGTFSFLVLTDIHIDYVKTVADGEYWYTTPVGGKLPDRPNIEREIAMVIEMANTTDVDCIILGGDLIHGTNSHANSMADLNYLAQVFQKAKVPVIASRGNHDNNDYHGKPCALEHIITNEEWTTTLIDPLAKDTLAVHDTENDPYSPYYYMDFPEKKTRVIVLDAWNYPIISTDGIHSTYSAENGWEMYGDNAQIEWFAKVALDAELQGWNYVLSTHAPIVGSMSGSSSNAGLLRNIITAFNNKTTIDVFGTTMDYSNYDGQMPLNVSGHTHIQSWRTLGDDHVAVNTGSGRFAYYTDDGTTDTATEKQYQPVRWEGTYSEACFDAVVYDPAINTIQRFNFGNRPDNKFVITDSGIEITETPHEGEYAE
ncbi:MAG: metallophosphoesterase [Clostridia bacterium]|nr:metallophosphoesterase [Clostridia bacterium]